MSASDPGIDRRTLLRGAMLLSTSAAVSAAVVGCSTSTSDATTAAVTTPIQSPDLAPSPSSGAPESSTSGSRILLAFFSRAGENYYYGGRRDLKIGNTKRVANKIAALVPVDVYEIEAEDPYPESYDATVARNVREQEADARPAIAKPLPDIGRYDTVLLGSGIWNVRPPMIMSTFLDGLDLAGKTIFPFVTFAVSGLGNTTSAYSELAPDSTIGQGLALLGETSKTSRPEVRAWLREIRLLP